MPLLLLGMHLRASCSNILPQVGSRFYQWVEWVASMTVAIAISTTSKRKITLMQKYYIKITGALKRLRTDYALSLHDALLIVGAVVCVVVLALFNGTGTTTLQGAL